MGQKGKGGLCIYVRCAGVLKAERNKETIDGHRWMEQSTGCTLEREIEQGNGPLEMQTMPSDSEIGEMLRL